MSYPASRKTWPEIATPALIPMKLRSTPISCGMRPVCKLPRDGLHKGKEQYDRVKKTPCAAIESMLGVFAHLQPATPIASPFCWSVVMSKTLGRLGTSAAANGPTAINAPRTMHRTRIHPVQAIALRMVSRLSRNRLQHFNTISIKHGIL